MDKNRKLSFLLLVSVLVIATCGLIYELVAGTLASYLLGDTITQFSTIIGLYLFSMGIGSFLSKYVRGNLLRTFVTVEIWVGIIGGFSSSILFLSFELVESFSFILYFLILLTGTLVGLEIPLLMRILNEYKIGFRDIVSKVFTFDYVGALAASLIFPLFFVPRLGLIKTSFFFGILNVAIAVLLLLRFPLEFKRRRGLLLFAFVSLAVLSAGFVSGDRIMHYAEALSYPDKVIYSQSSSYQRIVLTRGHNETRLFLNGNLQFSSQDEYRYHEALVHPVMQRSRQRSNVLVMGGGDGLALREILKYPDVQHVTLVDLDPALTNLFSGNEFLTRLNEHSLLSPKVEIVNQDAFIWIRNTVKKYDCVIIDFPDPSSFALGKLYSNLMYQSLHRILNPGAALVIQSTSPFFAPNSFWCINETLRSAGFTTLPYHCYVPSFGEWGFIMASEGDIAPVSAPLPAGLRFFTEAAFASMTHFPEDMKERPTGINRLNNQMLVHFFEKEWSTYTAH